MDKQTLGRAPKGPTMKAPPKTLIKSLPHGGKLPKRRKRKGGPNEDVLIIPDIEDALSAIVKKKPAK